MGTPSVRVAVDVAQLQMETCKDACAALVRAITYTAQGKVRVDSRCCVGVYVCLHLRMWVGGCVSGRRLTLKI
jgi:hypothetical protein